MLTDVELRLSSVSDTWRNPHSSEAHIASRHCGRHWRVQQQPHSVRCPTTVGRASPAKKQACPVNNHSDNTFSSSCFYVFSSRCVHMENVQYIHVSVSLQGAASASRFAVMESQTVRIFPMRRTVEVSPREMTSAPPSCRSQALSAAPGGM